MMLHSQRMYTRTVTSMVWIGLTLLLTLPTPLSHATGLRDEAMSYRAQGYEMQQRGDQAGALSFYQKAAALDPSYPAPYNDIGVLLEEQGRLEEAEHSYLQALTLNPEYLEAHANLAMLYERMGNKEKAIVHWIKRYELGDAHDPWTARAEDRLVALGVFKSHPGMKGRIYSARRLVNQELETHAKSLEEFHSVSEDRGTWR